MPADERLGRDACDADRPLGGAELQRDQASSASGAYNATQVAGFFGAGANNNNDTLTTSFTNGFVNGANEAAVPAIDPTALGTFFTPVAFVGAVRDANDTWYAGWTCNSGVANFGTTNTGACTSLPTN